MHLILSKKYHNTESEEANLIFIIFLLTINIWQITLTQNLCSYFESYEPLSSTQSNNNPNEASASFFMNKYLVMNRRK